MASAREEFLKKLLRFQLTAAEYRTLAKEYEARAEAEALEEEKKEEGSFTIEDENEEPASDPCVYQATYLDFSIAVKNIMRKRESAEGLESIVIQDWYDLVTDHLMEEFGTYNFGYYGDEELAIPFFPTNDQNILSEVLTQLSNACRYDPVEDAYDWDFTELLNQVKNYEFNMKHEILEWKYTKEQQKNFLDYFQENTYALGSASFAVIFLYRKLVEEGMKAKLPEAMQAKAYSMYGGNQVYECDYKASRDLLLTLMEMEGYQERKPFFANTLGYIYYYGRCNGGKPEYDKAFKYFAFGAFNGVYESMYKLADMYETGKGVIKSPATARNLITFVYDQSRTDFVAGEDNRTKFADAALRMGKIFEYGINADADVELAYMFYLEARCAIEKRVEEEGFFGDNKVHDNIEKALKRIKEKLPKGYFDGAAELRISFIQQLLEGNNVAELCYTPLPMERCKVKLELVEAEYPYNNVLLTIPELDYCDRVKELAFVTDLPLPLREDNENEEATDIQLDNGKEEKSAVAGTDIDGEVKLLVDRVEVALGDDTLLLVFAYEGEIVLVLPYREVVALR